MRITRLRVKVTDRCNYRCIFCHGEGSSGEVELLTPEDFNVIADFCTRLGIRRFKITGGEPLVRKDIVEIVRAFAGN